VRGDDLAGPVGDEGRLATRRLIEDAAEGVQIGAVIDVAGAAALLGRHEHRRAEDRAGGRVARAGAGVGQLGDAEVEELGAPAGGPLGIGDQHDVVGLEVAMDDAAVVGGRQRARDLPRQLDQLGLAHERPRQALAQGLTGDELHDDEGLAVGQVAEVVDLDDVGVAQGRGDAGLVEEPGHHVAGVGELRQQHLDRRRSAEQRVLGAVHGAHTTLAELAGDAVVADESAEHDPARIRPRRRSVKVGKRAVEHASRPALGGFGATLDSR
jgi:hypothetical protein